MVEKQKFNHGHINKQKETLSSKIDDYDENLLSAMNN